MHFYDFAVAIANGNFNSDGVTRRLWYKSESSLRTRSNLISATISSILSNWMLFSIPTLLIYFQPFVKTSKIENIFIQHSCRLNQIPSIEKIFLSLQTSLQ